MNMDSPHLIILNIILSLALNIHELELLPPLVLIIILSLNLNLGTHFTSNVDYHPISNQCLFKIIGGEYLDII